MKYLVFILVLLISCKKDVIAPISICDTKPFVEERELKSIILLPDTINIPVVVHVVYNQPIQNIPDIQVYSQIDVLNEDFNTPDTNNIIPQFRPIVGRAKIKFTLTGITRTFTTNPSFSSGGDVCYTNYGGIDPWDITKYLNIWVCNKIGAAGYSSYPWNLTPHTDGIIISYNYFGRIGTFTNNWNFTLGRTCTHEVGHYLGLAHTWADSPCGDDRVYDTPTQYGANGACPSFPHITCNNSPNGDNFQDFMDYTYDGCKSMFTRGQCERMRKLIYVYRIGFLN